MTQKLSAILLFMTIGQMVCAQGVTLYGKIIDIDEEPLVGVNVFVEGTNKGTSSDAKGVYELSGLSEGEKVKFSYIGYENETYAVSEQKGRESFDLLMTNDLLSLSEIIVTGNINSKEKLASSVAISTINTVEMAERVARNNADLLKAVPGLWVESVGGEGPANVWVRGFPQSGGYTFLGLMEDGLPIFQIGYNTLPSPDQFYKLDLTYSRIEAIRGGSSPIVMQGAAGAVINHISKTGGSSFEGTAQATYSPTQGTGKLALNLGGPISQGYAYNIGGFYRREQGIYDYGYPANVGGHVKGNITKYFDKGLVRVYGKYINDRVNWNLTAPYIFRSNGSLDEIPGFSLKSDGHSLHETDTKYTFTLPSGRQASGDLKDGFFTRLYSLGAQFEMDFASGWTLTNRLRGDYITHNNDADLLTSISPIDASRQYFYTNGEAIDNVGQLNGNGLQADFIFFQVDHTIKQLVNRLEALKSFNKVAFSIGVETFLFDMDIFSASALSSKEVTGAPRRLIADDPNSPGITPIAFFSPSGVNEANGLETTHSLFVSNEVTVNEKLRVDLGARYDFKRVDGENSLIGGASVLEGGQGHLIAGQRPFDDQAGNWTASVGFSYQFNEKAALFGRGSRGFSTLKLGDYTNAEANFDELRAVEDRIIYQYETGLKYGASNLAVFASLLYAEVNNAVSPIALPSQQGALIIQNTVLSTRTVSAEIEVQYKPTQHLTLKTISTLQNSTYSDLTFTASDETIVGGQQFDWSGNEAERVPKIAFDLTASYTLDKFDLYANYRYYSSRWSTPANNIRLNAYSEVYAGVGYKLTRKIAFNVQVANLFNTVALVEGDIRQDQFANKEAIDGTPRAGRRILPRALFFSVNYNF